MATAAPARVRPRPRPAAPPRRRSGPAPKRAPRTPHSALRTPQWSRRALSGLLGGRLFIVVVGTLLAGVVATNVGVLQLNGSIASTGQRAAELKRENAALRIKVAKLASSERIQRAAAEKGLVLPPPGDVRYLKSRGRLDAEKASEHITKPKPVEAVAPVVTTPSTGAAAPTSAAAPPATTAAPPAGTTAPQNQTAPAPTPAAPAPAQSTGQTPTGFTP